MSAIPSSAASGTRRRVRARVTVRGLRLASGLVLFAYVTTHLLNHALGNVSLRVMEAVLERVAWFWRLPPVGALLYGALAVHLALAIWAVYARPRFDWRPSEIAQMAFGLALPPILVSHVVATRLAYTLNGSLQTYAQQLRYFWIEAPASGVWQAVALVAAWAHGCIGLHLWLRLKPGYARFTPALLAAAMLVPVLALLGYARPARTSPPGSPIRPGGPATSRRRPHRAMAAGQITAAGRQTGRATAPARATAPDTGPPRTAPASTAHPRVRGRRDRPERPTRSPPSRAGCSSVWAPPCSSPCSAGSCAGWCSAGAGWCG